MKSFYKKSLYNIIFSLITVFSVLTSSVPINVHAQYYADITMDLNPSYPKIGDLATASVNSSDVNLDFQNITWYVNGVRKLSGIAKTSVVFEVEPDVTKYTIRAVIGELPSQVVREFTFTPGEVIMLWEAVDSYVPRWYKGKALMPAEGTVRITAIPVGAPSLDKLFFVWKQGYDSLGVQSGYGKNSIILTNTVFLDSLDVEVDISSSDNSYLSHGEISIPRADADVRLTSKASNGMQSYDKNNTLIVFGNEADVLALPYNMPTRNNLNGLIFNWVLNGQSFGALDEGSGDSIFISRNPAPIATEIVVQSFKHLLQEASAKKTIIFK